MTQNVFSSCSKSLIGTTFSTRHLLMGFPMWKYMLAFSSNSFFASWSKSRWDCSFLSFTMGEETRRQLGLVEQEVFKRPTKKCFCELNFSITPVNVHAWSDSYKLAWYLSFMYIQVKLEMKTTWTFPLSPPEGKLLPSLCHWHHHCWVSLRLHGGYHLLEGGSNTRENSSRTFPPPSSQKCFTIDCLGFYLMLICVWHGAMLRYTGSYSMACGLNVVFWVYMCRCRTMLGWAWVSFA